ncbi:MAG TPA: TetR/AcrR family transcriptional regulator [Pseudonocardia sp.]|jgi:AcrR family transcriptional regulator|nr:TetR/AcrR family transcriptional regulator [Pseudonocardia sp.]
MTEQLATQQASPTRDRIVRAAVELLTESGRDAVTTRSVSSAAGVQPPTIYRLFGDMDGLLDAVASYGFASYLRGKVDRVHATDPVEDLREGWDVHTDFGLANPAIYTLIYGDPRPGEQRTAAREAAEILRGLVRRVAAEARLLVSEQQAVDMIHNTGRGVTLGLIGTPPAERDRAVSDRVREAILAAVTTLPSGQPANTEEAGAARHAIALNAALPTSGADLSPAERAMLSEWLGRIATSAR